MDNNLNNEDLKGKLPPQSIDAEKSTLGCLMLDKNAIVKIVDFLKPSDFYKKKHQKIYKSIVELFEKQEAIDLLAVAGRLKEKDILTEMHLFFIKRNKKTNEGFQKKDNPPNEKPTEYNKR